ncbi:ABC transporter ATP-binding protein [Oceanobacillus alkalisoli]|uniref:ABC transporter ATP-binding protein n=1 Tax=Oceanobacillus alkalisoli TaxID=2925113 RepID=UPI001EF10891|nr:ABC transporter ATP-binding protein [Oceanobacillus alkalisoli]MCF3942099.1 ABC transporter ATP-binding protein/permease [Oceanobacillus alkalisoli]MCG5105041.1 ABC transporter ATP-binding protein/permease [Oceanobacillus alkalisoli]
MKNVFSFLKPYKISIILAYIFMFSELIIELLLPLFLGLMIDQGVLQEDVGNIVMWGGIMIGLAALSLVVGVLNSFYSSHVSFAFGYDLRQKLFSRIQYFSFKSLSNYPTSALVTRFTNDIRQIQNMVFMALRIMAKAPFLVLGGVTMAFIVNTRLALIFLVTVPLLILFLFLVMKYASKMFSNVQANVDHVNRVMQENLAGMRLIKAFGRRNFEKDRFTSANENLATSTKSTFRFVESTMPILLFIMNLSLIFIIWFGNVQSLAGNAAVGEVVSIVNYAMRVAMAISMFSFIIIILSRTKASAERVNEVLTLEDEGESEYDEAETEGNIAIKDGTVEYRNVYFQYPATDEVILKNVSFTIQAKETLAIMGATGSGKTSIFQLMPRLFDPTKGEVRIDGQAINSYAFHTLRGSIGYVPQNPLLFTGTIRDNIVWGKGGASDAEMIQAAKDAQIHDTIMHLPKQYDTRVGQKGVNLSGGQKQRISIARALIRKPKILMLDDSTSALDLATEARLLQAIEAYSCTIMIITQKISTARTTDRILLMDEGEVLAIGTHDELLKQSKLYQQIVESQHGKEYANVE